MFKNMKIRLKLAMIGMAFSLPIAVLLLFVIKGINYDIRFNTLEKYGNEYQRPLERLLDHISQHRLLAYDVLSPIKDFGDKSGRSGIKSELLKIQSHIDDDFALLVKVDQTIGKDLQVTDEGLAKRKREHLRVAACLLSRKR